MAKNFSKLMTDTKRKFSLEDTTQDYLIKTAENQTHGENFEKSQRIKLSYL